MKVYGTAVIFVNEFNGNILVANGVLISEPKKIWDHFYKNAKGMKEYYRKATNAVSKSEGGFIYYKHYKLRDPKALAPKVSFVYSVPEWKFYVGAGVYLDDIEADIELMQARLNKQTRTKVLYFTLLVFVIVLFFLYLFNKLSSRLFNDIDLFISFFNRAVHHDEKINRDKVKFSELDWMAQNANKMLQDKIDVQKDLKLHQEHLEELVDKRTEESEKAKERAEAANNAKSEFLANMTHELRTPLNAVIGFSELLSSIMSDEKQKSYVESIKTAGNSLLSLINDILDLSKIEANMLEIKPIVVDLRHVVVEIEQIFRVKIEEKAVEFIVDIDESMPKAIVLDELRIRQILFNIIGNAQKFTEKGYIRVKVRSLLINEAEATTNIAITVEDTGIGISENDFDKIFESFRQQDDLDINKFGGTGLGLAICKKLALAMGGDITVKSKLGTGSTFEVVLKNVSIASSEELSVKKEELYKFENTSCKYAQILVVDDIESNRAVLQETLPKIGLNVITAENGEVALEKIANEKPDLIFMDVRMPVCDGFEATKRIKGNPETKDIPVIALSASSSNQDKDAITKVGFDDFLSKPYKASELIFIINKYLECTSRELEQEANVLIGLEDNDLKQISNSSELIKILNNEVLLSCKSLKQAMIIGRVSELGERIKTLSKEHNAFCLEQIGLKLISHASKFDILNIGKEIDKLSEIINLLNIKLRELEG